MKTSTVTHKASLAVDKKTVRLEVIRDGHSLWDDLGPADVDLLIDGLQEMRSQMSDVPTKGSN